MKPRVFATLLLAATGGALAGTVTVRTMGQESIPPKWVARAGKMEGVCPDILAALEKIEPRLRFQGQHDARSVVVMEKGLETGQIDGACALLETSKRHRIANRVGPELYIVRHRIAAAHKDMVEIANLDELAKLNPMINTSRGAGYADQLKARGLQVDDSTGDNVINLKKVVAGHGRFMYMNELTLGYIISQEHLASKVRLLPTVFKEEPVYFWMSKQAPKESQQLVEQTLNKLKLNGELARIYERWSRIK